MYRFFIASEDIADGSITLTGGNARHIAVLRLKRDELFCVCDGRGTDYICRLISHDKDSALCEIVKRTESHSESKYKITLFQGLPKADKLELIIQKCVELGVYKIVPVITKNVVVKTTDFRKKIERLGKISESAAQQSGRGIVPEIAEPVSFDTAVDMLSEADEAYMAYEKQLDSSLRNAFERSLKNEASGIKVGFFVGPEGGFTEDEAETCRKSGIESVSLGKRILRTETAGLLMLSAYMYSRGEL